MKVLSKHVLLPKIVKVVEAYGNIGATSKNVIDHLGITRSDKDGKKELLRAVQELLSMHSNKRPCQKLLVRKQIVKQKRKGKNKREVMYTASSCHAEAKQQATPCFLCGAARYKGSFSLLGGSYGASHRDFYLKNVLPAVICEYCYRTRFFYVSKKQVVFCTGVATLPECFDRIETTAVQKRQPRLTAQEQMIKENYYVARKVKQSVDDLLRKLSTAKGREVLRWEAVKQRCSLHEARELLVAQITEQVATVSRKIFKNKVTQLGQAPVSPRKMYNAQAPAAISRRSSAKEPARQPARRAAGAPLRKIKSHDEANVRRRADSHGRKHHEPQGRRRGSSAHEDGHGRKHRVAHTRSQHDPHARSHHDGHGRKRQNSHASSQHDGYARRHTDGYARSHHDAYARSQHDGYARSHHDGYARSQHDPHATHARNYHDARRQHDSRSYAEDPRYPERARHNIVPDQTHARPPKSSRVLGFREFPRISGWLEKRGKKLFAKKWAKRLIEVDTQFLSIYKSTEDRKPKHLPIRMISAKHSASDAEPNRPHTFKLEIVGRPHDCIVFSAATAQEEQQWIDRISERIRSITGRRRKTVA